ncbi:MAG TPA: hypothetical protein VK939_12800 [Longimicrobiales bacterium]|nr:hypothetical protein [Longimicrobiales bacterium]
MPAAAFFAALLVFAVGACATSSESGTSSRPTRMVGLAGGDAEIQLQSEVLENQKMIPAAPAEVWDKLLLVYAELNLPMAQVDSATMTISNPALQVRRELAGRALSVYLNCGINLTGEIANQRRIRMTLVSRVRPVADGATVQTSLQAGAQTDGGASADAVACSSRGALEETIAQRVRGHVAVELLTPSP